MSDTSPLEYWLSLKLGESDTEIELERRADVQHATDLMVAQACNRLDVHSRDLDAPLYNRSAFLNEVARLCTSNNLFRMRVLCNDPSTAVSCGHRLIELSRKHSTTIEIRQVHHDYWHYNEAFLVANICGLIHRPLSDRYEGTANFNAPIIAQQRLDYFNEVWERSESHPDLRQLHI